MRRDGDPEIGIPVPPRRHVRVSLPTADILGPSLSYGPLSGRNSASFLLEKHLLEGFVSVVGQSTTRTGEATE